MPVVWRTRALADVSRIARYIASENPVAALRLARELLRIGDSLERFPRRGRPGLQAPERAITRVLERPTNKAFVLSSNPAER